jgi:fibronectin type 3 domain-containing protein
VTLTNSGNSDVTVSKVTVSGADYLSSGVSAGLTLAPGQSATLDATFTPAAAGSFPGSVTVVSNATNSPANISLSGSGTLAQTQQTTHSVSVTWSPSTSSVAGYNVYRSEVSGGPYSALESSIVAVDSYTDTNVQSGSTYYYVVKSVTAAGVESADSSQASVSVP